MNIRAFYVDIFCFYLEKYATVEQKIRNAFPYLKFAGLGGRGAVGVGGGHRLGRGGPVGVPRRGRGRRAVAVSSLSQYIHVMID